jgi:branched-chain amino acid transport system ATP-binding protein
VRRGIVQVPEGRRIFATLTVMENLEMGAYIHTKMTAAFKRMSSMYSSGSHA